MLVKNIDYVSKKCEELGWNENSFVNEVDDYFYVNGFSKQASLYYDFSIDGQDIRVEFLTGEKWNIDGDFLESEATCNIKFFN